MSQAFRKHGFWLFGWPTIASRLRLLDCMAFPLPTELYHRTKPVLAILIFPFNAFTDVVVCQATMDRASCVISTGSASSHK